MKDMLLILTLAALWAVGGFVMGVSIEALFGGQVVVTCTALNLITGMLMLLLVTRHERARRLFYEGPKENELGLPFIGLLWAIPFTLLFVGLIWWLLAQFLEH
jgi:hypothetical protein